ncbi:AAA family ATPase [Novosphingobium lindaniclasticum]
MQIVRFEAVGLNGYLDFAFDLHPEKNFLIGINGSGKTTVLRAIMALMGPDLDWIMNANFSSVAVELDIYGVRHRISVHPDGDDRYIFLSADGDDAAGTVIRKAEYHSMLRHRNSMAFEDDNDHIRVQDTSVDIPGSDEVLQRIKKIAAPVFLGLDRSNLPFSSSSHAARRRLMKRPHATLRSFLDESVGQAEFAASQARIRAKVSRDAKATQLREDMLLTLFTETASSDFAPRKADLRRYDKYRRSLKQAFSVLGLNKTRVEATVDPFFSKLISTSSLLVGKDFGEVLSEKNTAERVAFNEWIELYPRIPLFGELERLVTKFNVDEQNVFSETDAYLRIMNSFLEDSRKELYFGADGFLKIMLPSGEPASVHVLSSGERQLFVLITTLMFGEDASSSVLIIDEPELSLHLKWQEMFVSAIAEANPSVQLIFATHSPSIILDNEEYCVDLV